MPKPQPGRSLARRAASKEALKQMQHILGSEEKRVISSDDDVEFVEVQPPPKKKQKLTNRKSGEERDVIISRPNKPSDNTFELDCTVEFPEPCQLERKNRINQEENQIKSQLDTVLKNVHHETIFMGEFSSAIEIEKQIKEIVAPPQQAGNIILQTPNTTSTTNAGPTQSYQFVMDPRLGIVVGAVPTTTASTSAPPLQLIPAKVPPLTSTASTPTTPAIQTRRGTILKQIPSSAVTTQIKAAAQKNSSTPILQKQLQVKSVGKVQVQKPTPKSSPSAATLRGRPSIPSTQNQQTLQNIQKIGGLTVKSNTNKPVVDLTSDTADSREIVFNKLQGTTYPSLVVIARPHLKVKDLTSDRSKLDAKVKSVLMYLPTKFTEWLIQQGLVRSDQKCKKHPQNAMKLGMFSDATKFPHSGGYVWISECCVSDFAQVFDGSIFENCPHPPTAILKLIYHWCCQTIVQNVTQWVKVDNTYVKTIYTWLRAVCTVATHTHIKQLGGPGLKVQVGLISLGTSQNQNQKQVKVEVMGVMETQSGCIRLRAIKPVPEFERNYKKRFNKILEPMVTWVHPASIIITDMTVDKATLNSMGFAHVYQSTSTESPNSNAPIMEYLRRVVPRMFQNTLGHLSHQIIQQFLDELVWREWFGTTVLQAFDNIVLHLSEQTRFDSAQPLIVRLNAVSLNPFANWSIPLGGTPLATKVSDQPKRYNRATKKVPVVTTPILQKIPVTSTISTLTPTPAPVINPEVPRPAKSQSPDIPEQVVPLEGYYYGTIHLNREKSAPVKLGLKCPFCVNGFFTDNLSLMEHLFKHAHNVTNNAILCRYCLALVITGSDLSKHVASCHPEETKFDNGFMCLICEQRFMNPHILGKHMSKEHCPSELPYMCGTCNYRCSNHKQAIDHFYLHHKNGSTIQCPFCLKSTTIYSGQRNVTQNMNYFVQHLQKHQKKQLAKKCGKCNLWFVQKEFMKEHQSKMHMSQRGKFGLVPAMTPRNSIMVPKSKSDKCPDDGKVINFTTLKVNMRGNLVCKECSKPMNNAKHFSAFDSCQESNCQYSTCCTAAMKTHVTRMCKVIPTQIPVEQLPFELFCVCGFSNMDGNQMAKHLAICEKKSAYPSISAAQGATANNSMLDVLGLVRRPEEKNELGDHTDEAKKSDDDNDSDKQSVKENDAEDKNDKIEEDKNDKSEEDKTDKDKEDDVLEKVDETKDDTKENDAKDTEEVKEGEENEKKDTGKDTDEVEGQENGKKDAEKDTEEVKEVEEDDEEKNENKEADGKDKDVEMVENVT